MCFPSSFQTGLAMLLLWKSSERSGRKQRSCMSSIVVLPTKSCRIVTHVTMPIRRLWHNILMGEEQSDSPVFVNKWLIGRRTSLVAHGRATTWLYRAVFDSYLLIMALMCSNAIMRRCAIFTSQCLFLLTKLCFDRLNWNRKSTLSEAISNFNSVELKCCA